MELNRNTEVESLQVSPPDAKPMLYEVPTYLRQSSIGNKNRKTKRKKAMKNKEKLPSHCPHCGDLINYLNHKHHLYMYCTEEKSKTLLDGIEKKKNISKNTWYNFKDKHPPNDAEILVYGNKLEKYAVEYVDSEFETRKNNLNYFQWMLLRNKKTIYDKGR